MKHSEAMLNGFMQVGGRQCRGMYTQYDRGGNEVAHCVIGAIHAGGRALGGRDFTHQFLDAWGVTPVELNDMERLPWEHIYGMAKAAGL